MSAPDSTLFEDAIDVPLWLEDDRDTPYAERARREREIANRLDAGDARESAESRDSLTLVRGWWRLIASDAGVGARLDRLRALFALVMVVLGTVAGISLALAAFRYDGSQPVNVVRLLALLVGLQLLLLVLTLVLLVSRRVPGLRGAQELLAAFNPGAWAASVFARFARTKILERPFDRRAPIGAGRFAKWQVLAWSQLAAVAFNIAVLATAIALVTFTDLAFGWSTTLTVDTGRVARIVQAIAWPWQSLLPNAVPDADLVRQSQFFRLDAGSGEGSVAGDSRVLAGWWPFTLCAIVVYGLLPRLALLVVAGLRLRAATRDLLLGNPQVVALVDRMRSPVVETEADRHDERRPPAAARAAGLDHALGGRADAVIWEAAIAGDRARHEARRRFGIEIDQLLAAGGGRGLDGDRKTLDTLAASRSRTRSGSGSGSRSGSRSGSGSGAVLVFTPAWEPPVLEVLDFLKAARESVGAEASIVVVPVPESEGSLSAAELETWRHGVGRLHDPRLYVEVGAS